MQPEIWIILGIFAVAVIVWSLVKSVREDADQRREGTGTYKKYGPNPTKERMEYVKTAEMLYRRGVMWKMRGNDDEAKRLWDESASMNNAQAITGMGILEYEHDKSSARPHWRRAAAHGDVPAKIFLELATAKKPPISVTEFAREFLAAENYKNVSDFDAMHVTIGVAAHYGYEDYAKQVAKITGIEEQKRRLY